MPGPADDRDPGVTLFEGVAQHLTHVCLTDLRVGRLRSARAEPAGPQLGHRVGDDVERVLLAGA